MVSPNSYGTKYGLLIPLDLFPLIARHSDVDSIKRLRLTCSSVNKLVASVFANMALWRIFFNMAPHSLERMVQICTATWAARHVEEIHLPAGIDRSSGFQANSPARSSPRAVLKSICDALKIALQGLQRAQNYQVRVIVSQFNFPGYPRPRNLQRCVLEAMLESEYPLEQLHLLLELHPHKMWNWEIMPDGLPLHLGTTLKKLIVECKPPGIGEEHSTERSVFEDTALARTLDHSIRLEHLQVIGEPGTYNDSLREEICKHLQKRCLKSLDFPMPRRIKSDLDNFRNAKRRLSLRLAQYNAAAFTKTDYPALPRITLTRSSYQRHTQYYRPNNSSNSFERTVKEMTSEPIIRHQWDWDKAIFVELESDAAEMIEPILDIWHRYREGFEEMQQFFEKVEKVQNFTLSQSLSIEEEFQNLNKKMIDMYQKLRYTLV